MRDWLDQWQLPATSTAAPTAWMAGDRGPAARTMNSSGDALMPGTATAEQLDRLRGDRSGHRHAVLLAS